MGGCWPTPQQEWLLRAALLPGDDAVRFWEVWKSQVDFNNLDWGSYRLLPLLYRNLRAHRVQDPWLDKLKGIYRHTWLKNQLLFREMLYLLQAFHQAGIQTMILKGVPLIVLYLKDYGLRPMNDFDVLIRSKDLNQAAGLLAEWKWKPKFRAPHAWGFITTKGNEFDLHWHVLAECCEVDADDDFWEAAIPMQIAGFETRALNATDQLLHVCIHGVAWNAIAPIRWIADAIEILNASEIDWTRLVSQAQQRHLTLSLSASLGYLHRLFDAPIPEKVLKEVSALPVSRVERLDYEAKTSVPNERGAFLAAWAYYREYRRSVEGKTWAYKLVAFPGFLRTLWGLDHDWQVPVFAAVGAAKRIWKTLRTSFRTPP